MALVVAVGSSLPSAAASSPRPPATASLPAFAREARLGPTGDALGDLYDSYGASVAADGDTVAVGVPSHDLPSVDAGCVYVYGRSAGAWTMTAKLLSPDAGTVLRFGSRVTLEADTLVVAAESYSSSSPVYVFVRLAGAWSLLAGGEGFRFGKTVALEAGTLAVGAPGQRDGRVHVYGEIAGVGIPRALLALTTAGQGPFGGALALRGGQLLVGFDPYWMSAGAAELFTSSGASWTPGTPLVPAGLEPEDLYGAAVALAGATAIVGAPNRLGTGTVWVWTGSGSSWTIQSRLDNPGTTTTDAFGSALALENTTLVVGAPDDDTVSGRNSGAVYVFERVGPARELRQKLLPPPGMPGAWSGDGPRFGTSVALSGDRLCGRRAARAPAGTCPRLHAHGRHLVAGRGAGAVGPLLVRRVRDRGRAPRHAFAGRRSPAGSSSANQLPIRRPDRRAGSCTCSDRRPPTWPMVVELATSDANPANDTASLSLTVSPSVADVSLSISGPGYARVGESITCQIALVDAGPGAAVGLQIEWASPPGHVLDHVVGCDPANSRIARLGVGQTWVQVAYQVPVDYSGPVPIVFSASVTTLSQDPALANNQDSHSSLFVPPPVPLDYYTITPCRLYDSRATGGPLQAGEVRVVSTYATACGIGYGARALALNVTETGATAAGNVRVYPAYSPVPTSSSRRQALAWRS